MQKITQKQIEQMNEEVSSDNFEHIVDKYRLDTPEEYSHSALCEIDGVEVWGISEEGEVMVYDNVNGFYFLPIEKWVQEIRNIYEDEADEILSEISALKALILHEFKIKGFEAIERTATPSGNSNRVYVPKTWTRVMVIRLE